MLNSDMINDEEHLYFSIIDNYFEFLRFPISDELVHSINDCMREIYKMYGEMPTDVFIPFIPYNNFVVTKSNDEFSDMLNLGDLLYRKIQIHIMVPDILKKRISINEKTII